MSPKILDNEFDASDIYNIQAVLGDRNIVEWIDNVKKDSSACNIVKIATNENHNELSDLYYLAYIVGKFVGV